MRSVGLLPALLLSGVVIISGAIIWQTRNSDLVTTQYPTVHDARSNGAFQRGWLPPVLPDSARKIIETNNLDLNTGEGSFEFEAADYQTLVSRLAPASREVAGRYWDAQKVQGFSFFRHSDQNTIWTLALHPRGTGFYTVATVR